MYTMLKIVVCAAVICVMVLLSLAAWRGLSDDSDAAEQSVLRVIADNKGDEMRDASTTRQGSPEHAPNRQRFNQVSIGMTRDRVYAVVGAPPGNYVPPEFTVALCPRGFGYIEYEQWVTTEGELLVLFGPENTVVDAKVWDVMRP